MHVSLKHNCHTTHILWYQVPSLPESLNSSGVECSGDLKHRHKVIPLQSVLGHLQPETDHSTAFLGLVQGEDCFRDPLGHLVEPGYHVADVGC